MRNTSPQVTEYIAQLEQRQQEIVHPLRSMLLDLTPELEERWIFNSPFYCLGERLFYISVKPRQVLLAFCNGAQLDDPDHLLIGDLEKVRHCLIGNASKAAQPELKALLQQAILLNGKE